MSDRLLKVNEVADILRVNRKTILRHISDGSIKAVKFGKEWRIKESEIERIYK